ncbi:MAG: AsnC family transcriptional regulator [Nitrosopumilales archaeon CG15_BIG_FIL_POST_REV_8_21_14_020_37_12]|nr:Lrp/AsnC ligand binding domain-containing protein [Nitrosarchaeum sp.]MCV0398730.1 Lrp/AsnC ligand binding domain-containing protein [Nitrosarchaeum sp.]PIW33064.1 MAG: AsnC family transcriptional regulator [Nitrosopumilales archaeon CG15_BIG_FIL_POST_REV_8_21_14_020_37_12]
MQAYILLTCNSGSETDIIAEIKKIPNVKEVNGVWGKYDIFLKVSTDDPQGIDKVVSHLRTLRDITSSYTMHVLYGQGGTIDE